jgi:hypothetical protein
VTSSTPSHPPDPAWKCVDPASLADASVDTLDRFFLELCRRTIGGDLSSAPVISTLEIAPVERIVTRRYGPAAVGLVRAERVALESPAHPASVAWDVQGLAGIEVRGRYQPGIDGKDAVTRMPVQLRDEQAGRLFVAAWRQAFGSEPRLIDLRAPERLKTKGPPFRCTNCGDVLPSEPEDTRTCPRCLSPLEPARPIAAGQWGPMRAELHAAGLHRLFSSFTRNVDTDVAVDVVFDASPEQAAVPPCAGVAIGPTGATRALLLRPDGKFAVTREQLVEGREPGMYPRERVMAVDWTEHPTLGRGLGERNRIRVAVDRLGMRAWLGDKLLFTLTAAPDDADAKCVCLVAGCDARGTSVRFERFQIAEVEDEPASDDPTRVDERPPTT